LEVCDITGKKFSDLNTDIRKPSPEYDSILIGLSMERKVLYERINQRVDEMLSQGLVEEVRSLLEKGYGKDLVSMRGIGYKEIIAYLEGSMDYDQAVSLLKQNTRRFAKRQYTWFLKDENVKWFRMDKAEEIDNTIKDIETYISTRLN
jgi:tRNA dimethylallyltransferase